MTRPTIQQNVSCQPKARELEIRSSIEEINSLKNSPNSTKIGRILQAALFAIHPGEAIQKSMKLEQNRLHVKEQTYHLDSYGRIRIVAFGKASLPMAIATAKILGDWLTDSLVITKHGYEQRADLTNEVYLTSLSILTASHPIPDESSLQAARELEYFLRTCQPDDLLICLISGGGSALVTYPAIGVTHVDMQNLTHLLLGSGAPIEAINTLRKHLDIMKGGGMARLASQPDKIVLILSDVIGDPIDMIASGPFVPDPSTYADAWNILEKYALVNQIPSSIVHHLQSGLRGEISETAKPGDPIFDRLQTEIIGSNLQAALAAKSQAKTEGFHSLILTTRLQGEASLAGRFLANILSDMAVTGNPLPRPACLIVGGETTVTVRGPGLGGRNQELALSAVQELSGLEDIALITLATDGVDGPTEAAGAVVTGETCTRGLQAGLDLSTYLMKNDSFHYFSTLQDLLNTGPTLTNANDLTFLFTF
jgi:hydroxypyruvate reductase